MTRYLSSLTPFLPTATWVSLIYKLPPGSGAKAPYSAPWRKVTDFFLPVLGQIMRILKGSKRIFVCENKRRLWLTIYLR